MANKNTLNAKTIIKEILIIVLLPNIFFLIVAELLGLGRPYINIDYTICAFAYLFLHKSIGITCYALSIIFDTLRLSNQIIPAPRIEDNLYLISNLFSSSKTIQFMVIATGIILITKIYLFHRLQNKVRPITFIFILNIFLAIYLPQKYLFSKENSDNRFYRNTEISIISSQSTEFFHYRNVGFIESFSRDISILKESKKESASDDIHHRLNKDKEIPSRLLLIVAESWGVPQHPEIQKELLKPILNTENAEISQGTIPYKGITVRGEMRELCKKSPTTLNLKEVTEGFDSCLANRLAKRGYNTIAMHGATGTMYDRLYWYPRAGFQEQIFFESKTWPSLCHSFPGACDNDLINEVPKYFSDNTKKVFFYWLTLNSHAIYDIRDIKVDLFDCKKYNIPHSQSCRNFKLQAQFFNSLSELLKKDSMKNTTTIVVADHPPVIFSNEEKIKYFKDDTIPWIKVKI